MPSYLVGSGILLSTGATSRRYLRSRLLDQCRSYCSCGRWRWISCIQLLQVRQAPAISSLRAVPFDLTVNLPSCSPIVLFTTTENADGAIISAGTKDDQLAEILKGNETLFSAKVASDLIPIFHAETHLPPESFPLRCRCHLQASLPTLNC